MSGKNNSLKGLTKRAHGRILSEKRAMSVVLTSLIITAAVIAAGIAVTYWAYTWGNTANDQYATNVANSQSSMGERIAFEYILYNSSSNSLTVYVINCGKSNNVNVARVYIWDNSSQLIGTFNTSSLRDTSTKALLPGGLNIGNEGYFTITIVGNPSFHQDSYFSLRVVTDRGRNYDGSFSS